MKRYCRKCKNVVFMYYCPNSIMIEIDGCVQYHRNGAWIKLKKENNQWVIGSLVANGANNQPVGWEAKNNGSFVKKDIYAEQSSNKISLMTLDGPVEYENEEGTAWILYNQKEDGSVDWNDCWFITDEDFQENYYDPD